MLHKFKNFMLSARLCIFLFIIQYSLIITMQMDLLQKKNNNPIPFIAPAYTKINNSCQTNKQNNFLEMKIELHIKLNGNYFLRHFRSQVFLLALYFIHPTT